MTSPAQFMVFHPGTQHSWQTARALDELGRLQSYTTSIFYDPSRWPYKLERLPGSLGRWLHNEFRRFEAPGLDPRRVRTAGYHEWFERLAYRAGSAAMARRIDVLGNKAFARTLERTIRSDKPFALWGYDGSSRAAFELAKRHGRACVLDVTIGHRRALNKAMEGIKQDRPEWFGLTPHLVPERMLEEFDRELELADVALVGSEFARQTLLAEAPGLGLENKLHVLPYCWDQALFGQQPAPQPVDRNGPVKFLVVGQLGARKGIHLLLEAISRIPAPQASLTMLGGFMAPERAFAPYMDRVRHIPHVARNKVPALMAEHHVLIFPSFFEGSALSLLEALASGLGIIQSASSGNGATPETGIVLNELSVDAITEAMMVPVRDRDLLDSWRGHAQVEAQKYTFDRYRENIAARLEQAGL